MSDYYRHFTSFYFLLLVSFASAQETTADSTVTITEENKNSFTSIFYGQPGKAALYSLILPSAGQIYNKRYWKVPIILAIEGGAVWYLSSKIKSFRDHDTCWKSFVTNALEPDPICSSDDLGYTDTNTAFDARQSVRSQKDLAWVFMGIAHLFNVIEAFVDRHLINFDTSEDLSFRISPQSNFQNSMNNSTINLFTISIPLNSK